MSEAASQIVENIVNADTVVQTEPAVEANKDVQSQAAANEPKAQENPKDERISSKLEVLIRREKAALERERLAKAKEAELEAKLARFNEFDSLKDNPKKALDLLGLTYEQLTQSLLQDGELPPEIKIKKVEDKVDQFLKAREDEERQRAEQEKKRLEDEQAKVVSQFQDEIKTYLKDNSSRYEFINFEGQQDLVFEVIDEHFARTQKVLSITEAADKVEQYLEDKYNKAKALSKVKTLWGAVPPEALKKAVEQTKSAVQTPPRTLTNKLSASPSTPLKRPVTDEERIQRAIAFAKGIRPSV
jgi:hypothetical protein